MKKIILISGIIFAIISSCTSKGTLENDLEKRNLKGAVKSIKDESFELISESGEFRKGNKTLNSDPDVYTIFNKDGFTTEKKTYNMDGSVANIYMYEYNKDNQLAKETKYTATENIDRVFAYSYDEETGKLESQSIYTALGNLDATNKFFYEGSLMIKEESFDGTGKLNYFWTYEYDKNGNMTKKSWLVNNSVIDMFYVYDDKKQLLEVAEVNESNSMTKWKYTYNELKNLSEEVCVFFDNSELRTDYKYEYDAQGNWIIKFVFQNDLPVFMTERTIVYY